MPKSPATSNAYRLRRLARSRSRRLHDHLFKLNKKLFQVTFCSIFVDENFLKATLSFLNIGSPIRVRREASEDSQEEENTFDENF